MRRSAVILSLLLLLAGGPLLLEACRKSDVSAHRTTPRSFTPPPGFPAPHYDFAANPLTEEGIELGRKLFYDGLLSKDGNSPCASCHQQFAGFATYDHDLSHGFNNSFTTRNAPALANLAWQKEFHHDGGINHIEVQPLAPLTAANEMAETIENINAKLRADDAYPVRFQAAFGDAEISSQRILKALSQFMLTLVSDNSKYDRVRAGRESFNAMEAAGYAVFRAKCGSCHQEPLFTDLTYRNIGLPLNSFLQDYGRMRITGKGTDSLRFKVPSLRNVSMTFPYMHDGRFWTLTDAVNHYRTGMVAGPTLDPLLQNGMPMSDTEVQQVVAFLRTLTDTAFLKNPKFAQPQ